MITEEGRGIRFLKILVPVPDGSEKLGTTFQTLHEMELAKTRVAVAWEAEKINERIIPLLSVGACLQQDSPCQCLGFWGIATWGQRTGQPHFT